LFIGKSSFHGVNPSDSNVPVANSADPAPAAPGYDTFFRLYEPSFGNEFRREFRYATGRDSATADVALDSKALYHALFLPDEVADAANAVRASFRQLADSTEEAEAILRRTCMIMATDFIDYRLKHGGSAEDVRVLQDMFEEYSTLLNEVCRDISRSVALEIPEIDVGADGYRKIIQDFRHYLSQSLDEEFKRWLCVFTCFRGVPVDSPAQVVSVSDEGVTLRVSATQVAILGKTGLALVESPVHGAAFRAYSSRVDAAAYEVTFSHFIRHDQPLERRQHSRIRPQRPLPVTIRKASKEFTGWLFDVSAVAAAIQLRNLELAPLKEGDSVELYFALPRIAGAGEISMSLPGRVNMICRNDEDDRQAVRVVVKMPGSAKLCTQISEYVTDRKNRALTERCCKDDGNQRG